MSFVGKQLQELDNSTGLNLTVKMARARANSAHIDGRVARRLSLYKGEGKVVNVRTGREVQLECHRNMAYELIESEVSNSIPMPAISAQHPDDIERASRAEDYIAQIMMRENIVDINDAAERGTYINGYHWYHVFWDSEAKTNSGWGAASIKEYKAGDVWLQPGIKRFQDAEYLFTRDVATCQSIKRVYGIDVVPDDNGLDTATITTAWYLDDKRRLGRTIFTEAGTIIAHDPYYALRRVGACSVCGTVKLELNGQCQVCNSEKWHYKLLTEQVLDEPLLSGDPKRAARMRDEAEARGEEVDDTYGFEVIAEAGTVIPFYVIDELPFVLRINVSDIADIWGLSDIDRIERNQDTLNRLTTKAQENLLKAGSFVTYPDGTRIPADDSTLKMVPVKDPRMINAFGVHNIQANMQQDDIFNERMYMYGRATLGITESFQGKQDGSATSGVAKQFAAAQSAGRIESKRRTKESACRKLFRLLFKFELAYQDEVQAYLYRRPNGDVVKRMFSRYDYLRRNANGTWSWNDNFIFDVDSSSLISMNRESMWEMITTQFLAGTFGNPTEPPTMKLYWEMMKYYQLPFANAALSNLEDRMEELPWAIQQFILSNPQMLEELARMTAEAQAAEGSDRAPRGRTDAPVSETGAGLRAGGPGNSTQPQVQEPINELPSSVEGAL